MGMHSYFMFVSDQNVTVNMKLLSVNSSLKNRLAWTDENNHYKFITDQQLEDVAFPIETFAQGLDGGKLYAYVEYELISFLDAVACCVSSVVDLHFYYEEGSIHKITLDPVKREMRWNMSSDDCSEDTFIKKLTLNDGKQLFAQQCEDICENANWNSDHDIPKTIVWEDFLGDSTGNPTDSNFMSTFITEECFKKGILCYLNTVSERKSERKNKRNKRKAVAAFLQQDIETRYATSSFLGTYFSTPNLPLLISTPWLQKEMDEDKYGSLSHVDVAKYQAMLASDPSFPSTVVVATRKLRPDNRR